MIVKVLAYTGVVLLAIIELIFFLFPLYTSRTHKGASKVSVLFALIIAFGVLSAVYLATH